MFVLFAGPIDASHVRQLLAAPVELQAAQHPLSLAMPSQRTYGGAAAALAAPAAKAAGRDNGKELWKSMQLGPLTVDAVKNGWFFQGQRKGGLNLGLCRRYCAAAEGLSQQGSPDEMQRRLVDYITAGRKAPKNAGVSVRPGSSTRQFDPAWRVEATATAEPVEPANKKARKTAVMKKSDN